MNFFKNLLFLQGFIIFVIHFIFSPYPINSINRFKNAFKNEYLKTLKIKNKTLRKNFTIDKDGFRFKIVSFGAKVIQPDYSYFFFIAEKYKFQSYENGLYVISIPYKKPSYLSVKVYDLNKNAFDFIKYVGEKLPDSGLVILSFKNFNFESYDKSIDSIFIRIGAMNYEKAKRGYSYIFIVKKEGKNFIPVRELFSDRKILFVNFKIKV